MHKYNSTNAQKYKTSKVNCKAAASTEIQCNCNCEGDKILGGARHNVTKGGSL